MVLHLSGGRKNCLREEVLLHCCPQDLNDRAPFLRCENKSVKVNTLFSDLRWQRAVLVSKDVSSSPRVSRSSEVNKIVRIVVAEDEPDVQAVYSLILRSSGFSVTKMFDNGKDLVDFLRRSFDPETEPDLVITDLRMPRMDGIEAAKNIRTLRPHIKIIMATAYDIPNDSIPIFDGVLRKPFRKKELIEAIARCLDRA